MDGNNSANGREGAKGPGQHAQAGWVGVSEAAAFLGLTEGALRQAVARRQLPFSKLGRRLRFKLAELDAHVRKGWVPPISDDGIPADPLQEERS